MVTHENLDLVFQVRTLAGQYLEFLEKFKAARKGQLGAMKNLRTIILAAGKGTRMKSDVPKVLHEVCGRAVIEYVIDVARAAGSLKTYIVLGHKMDEVKEHLEEDLIVVAQKKLLGTADAVRSAEKYFRNFNGDVLILCGDTPLLHSATIKNIVNKHRRSRAACTFLTAVVHNPQGYGRIIRGEQGPVVAIREDKDAEGLERNIAEINVGVYCFQSKFLFQALKEVKLNPKKREFYLTDTIENFSQKNLKIETVETLEPVEGMGINTKEDLAITQDAMRQRILRDFMLQGITVVDPATTYIDASVKIGQDTVIKPFTFIEGNVRIGRRCKIGPFARLRPGTRIGNNVEVGNFTEVSRTKVGHHTLVKHFSFLGDAVIGSRVNIGAGTVTANFDGTNKNTTQILDQAFIGSDSILVAPVKIGTRAVTAAGSVITRGKNVPDGSVAMGVPAVITSRRNIS